MKDLPKDREEHKPVLNVDISNKAVLDLLFKDGVQPDKNYKYIQSELIQKFNGYVREFAMENGKMLKYLIAQNSKHRLISKLCLLYTSPSPRDS